MKPKPNQQIDLTTASESEAFSIIQKSKMGVERCESGIQRVNTEKRVISDRARTSDQPYPREELKPLNEELLSFTDEKIFLLEKIALCEQRLKEIATEREDASAEDAAAVIRGLIGGELRAADHETDLAYKSLCAALRRRQAAILKVKAVLPPGVFPYRLESQRTMGAAAAHAGLHEFMDVPPRSLRSARALEDTSAIMLERWLRLERIYPNGVMFFDGPDGADIEPVDDVT